MYIDPTVCRCLVQCLNSVFNVKASRHFQPGEIFANLRIAFVSSSSAQCMAGMADESMINVFPFFVF